MMLHDHQVWVSRRPAVLVFAVLENYGERILDVTAISEQASDMGVKPFRQVSP